MTVKRALVTGITGQDGSYLAEFLLARGYEVHGLVRRTSTQRMDRIQHLEDQLSLHAGDLTDLASLVEVVELVQPTEVYNLAAQSFVGCSWRQPLLTSEVTALGTLRLLEAVRLVDSSIRFYQASSSEMFGKVVETPQRETTPLHPRSPYGVAKVYAHQMTVNYRESHGLFACSGILFNHESPRRGKEFVTRKITDGVARIRCGLQDQLALGNLASQRDWGFAGDYVRAMWAMLQLDEPMDFVVGTGVCHSVEEFVEIAFDRAGLNWRDHVVIDPKFFRPAEVDLLMADCSLAREVLGWEPEVDFRGLVERMVDADLARYRGGAVDAA